MHEYSLVLSLIERVEQEIRNHSASAALSVKVSVGELSGVEADLLSSAFEVAREGTLLSATKLRVTRVAARWLCSNCGCNVDSTRSLVCGDCASPARLAEGGDILLESVELEVP